MKFELFPFQRDAVSKLRQKVATALGNYQSTHTPQVVSYTAPTGAGKTIVMSALIESIYYGDGIYPDHKEAIFVWLSDSPQLNEQSRLKIDLKADKIQLNQCVTISDDSFDMEMLEDGHIYFLNTQKLSKTCNLTKHSDARKYTIWETLANTVREKSNRLYFIIDEAHRGAQGARDLSTNTTIMQKFLKGSDSDHLPPMPVVIGMTATPQRFNRLVEGLQSTTHYAQTTVEEVRASGLLKDRIVITYPEHTGNDMAVLQAATDEWKNKWDHWYQYCYEQHYSQVNPIFLIQVQNGTANQISATDLNECLRIIEERLNEHFKEGNVVHAFGEGTPAIQICGLNVPYCEPSRIADNKSVKVVFFKETLSTGWDCPRAETMMSFRRAVDYTYVAQLLGRMVRTPLQQHINIDDTLNDVHLYLPQFSETTVNEVVKALQNEEGATIPTDVETEQMGNANYDVLSLRPSYRQETLHKQDGQALMPGETNVRDAVSPKVSKIAEPSNGDTQPSNGDIQPSNGDTQPSNGDIRPSNGDTQPLNRDTQTLQTINQADSNSHNGDMLAVQNRAEHLSQQTRSVQQSEQASVSESDADRGPVIDRESVVKAINDAGLLTQYVRKIRISENYLKSLYALARLLMESEIEKNAKELVFADITQRIHDHIEMLKNNNTYDEFVGQVKKFKLSAQTFDVFGKPLLESLHLDLYSTTDLDIERNFIQAENKLGNEGVGNAYVNRYYDSDDLLNLKIHVIIFAANADCMDALNSYSKQKFHDLNDTYRRRTVKLSERFKKQYNDIVSDGDIVSNHNFQLPETIRVPHDAAGKNYRNHLFVDDYGIARIILNNWEQKVIEEEEQQDDFVYWLRNQARSSWALCISYEIDGCMKPAYPDFLIIRRDSSGGFVVDILEPHDPTRIDNLGKAKGFAEYAKNNPGIGRIQLIRIQKDPIGRERAFRLDMSKSAVRDKVSRCASNDELNHIFRDEGFFMPLKQQ